MEHDHGGDGERPQAFDVGPEPLVEVPSEGPPDGVRPLRTTPRRGGPDDAVARRPAHGGVGDRQGASGRTMLPPPGAHVAGRAIPWRRRRRVHWGTEASRARRPRSRDAQAGEAPARRTPAQTGPGEVADLAGHLVGVEVVAPLDEAAAGALGQADEGVGQGQAVLGVDVGLDQRGDRLRHAGGHLAHGPAELLVAARPAAVQQHERGVVLGDPAEVGPEPRSRSSSGRRARRPWR